jgi:hypothetical protein
MENKPYIVYHIPTVSDYKTRVTVLRKEKKDARRNDRRESELPCAGADRPRRSAASRSEVITLAVKPPCHSGIQDEKMKQDGNTSTEPGGQKGEKTAPGGFRRRLRRLGNFHCLTAIPTDKVYFFRGADRHTAHRANIFASAARNLLFGVLGLPRTMHREFTVPVLTSAEAAKGGCRLYDGPADFLIILDRQAALFSLSLKPAIMIRAASGGTGNRLS